MAEEASDPKIIERLSKLPPFDDEVPAETPVVEPEVAPQVAEETPVEETPIEETPTEEASGDEQKKRTQEQFEKLKAHNAELKKKLEEQQAARTPQKNALDALIPPETEEPVTNVVPAAQQYPSLTQKEIKDTFAGLTDEQGYVDTGLLKETLVGLQKAKEEAERRAAEAESRVKKVERRQDDFERKQLMQRVHEMYPKLNPENANSQDPNIKFDEAFYDAFQGEVMRQWSTVGKEDVWSASKKWSDILYGNMKKAEKEKADAAELAKRNINATSTRPTSTHETYKDADELIVGTRKGEHGAIMERLKRIGQ